MGHRPAGVGVGHGDGAAAWLIGPIKARSTVNFITFAVRTRFLTV